ncbi:MAG: PIG-L family deacetylase [Chitinophagaceae bacterium]|nr:PIG-L family deacetylase [Chitinophagaceae bacterium]
MLESLRNKRILIVVAHPDDELLGLGASMNKLIREFNVHTRVVILGEGITSRAGHRDVDKWKEELSIHRTNAEKAQEAIGYHELSMHSFPDNRFDSVPLLDIIKVIEQERDSFMPEIVFTHHGGDVNIDHQRTFEAVITACRPLAEQPVKTIITFETPSGTEWRASTDPRHFVPNLFFVVREENVLAKIRAMECYTFEKREFPHPRSPRALTILANRWGVAVGAEFAEAFAIVRNICCL